MGHRLRARGNPPSAATGLTTFSPLRLGAGGYVTGIEIAASGTKKVARTDVGGGYVWNNTSGKWEQIFTSTRCGSDAPTEPGSSNYDGVYEIRIAPSNEQIGYAVFNGWVWKTTDYFATVSKTAFTRDNNLGANNGGIVVGDAFADRYHSYKLAIDPLDSNVVYLGTKSNGAWYTRDGGSTWTQISNATIPFSSGTDNGHRVVIDPSSSTTSGRKSVVYISSRGNGLYKSTDGGSTWSLLSGSPTDIANMKITHTGIVYTAGGDGHIRKYNGTSWADKSPNTNSGQWVNVITHPSNALSIIAVLDSGDMRISSDGGDNYSAQTSATRTASDIPWLAWTEETYMSNADMVWDPVTSGRLWFAQGIGVWYADSISTSTTTVAWQSASADIEELVVNEIHKPSGSNLYVAVWDRNLFKITNPDTYPSTHQDRTRQISWCWSIDSAPSDPTFLVEYMDKFDDASSKSSDSGANWTLMSNLGTTIGSGGGSIYGGHIAVSTSSNFVLAGRAGNGAYYTTNGGTTWTACTLAGTPGSSGWGQAVSVKRRGVDSDKVTANKFYLFNSVTGFYRTTDGGANWTRVISDPKFGIFGSTATHYHAKLRAVPGQAGHIFFTAGGDGQEEEFIRSTDSGSTWSAVSNVTEVFAFGFGAAAPSGSYPAIFIAGKVSNVWGIWRSNDNCSSWTNLATFPRGNFDFVTCVEGDPDVYGKVYIGFNGTGAVYGVLS